MERDAGRAKGAREAEVNAESEGEGERRTQKRGRDREYTNEPGGGGGGGVGTERKYRDGARVECYNNLDDMLARRRAQPRYETHVVTGIACVAQDISRVNGVKLVSLLDA